MLGTVEMGRNEELISVAVWLGQTARDDFSGSFLSWAQGELQAQEKLQALQSDRSKVLT